jgi:hypothetical protein
MPVTGAKPKPSGQTRHRVKPTYDWVNVLDVPYDGKIPALPKRPGKFEGRTAPSPGRPLGTAGLALWERAWRTSVSGLAAFKIDNNPVAPQEWPAETKRWWRTVSHMPHCILWTEGDWQFALDTALIAAGFHAGDMRLAAELRAREKVLGTTADARRDLRIRYIDEAADDESAEDQGSVTAMADYKQMVSGQ